MTRAKALNGGWRRCATGAEPFGIPPPPFPALHLTPRRPSSLQVREGFHKYAPACGLQHGCNILKDWVDPNAGCTDPSQPHRLPTAGGGGGGGAAAALIVLLALSSVAAGGWWAQRALLRRGRRLLLLRRWPFVRVVPVGRSGAGVRTSRTDHLLDNSPYGLSSNAAAAAAAASAPPHQRFPRSPSAGGVGLEPLSDVRLDGATVSVTSRRAVHFADDPPRPVVASPLTGGAAVASPLTAALPEAIPVPIAEEEAEAAEALPVVTPLPV